MLHQVTIGAPTGRRLEQMPTLGDNVFVGAGSRLIGRIKIGDDVFVGVSRVVTEDTPAGTKVTTTAGLLLEAGGGAPADGESGLGRRAAS